MRSSPTSNSVVAEGDSCEISTKSGRRDATAGGVAFSRPGVGVVETGGSAAGRLERAMTTANETTDAVAITTTPASTPWREDMGLTVQTGGAVSG
jgi:hypothetical protein